MEEIFDDLEELETLKELKEQYPDKIIIEGNCSDCENCSRISIYKLEDMMKISNKMVYDEEDSFEMVMMIMDIAYDMFIQDHPSISENEFKKVHSIISNDLNNNENSKIKNILEPISDMEFYTLYALDTDVEYSNSDELKMDLSLEIKDEIERVYKKYKQQQKKKNI